MPAADIVIALVILASMVVGFLRGFVREVISIVTLVIAIWAALTFAPYGGSLVENWVSSDGLQLWVGRLLIFLAVLLAGGIIGWAISKIVLASSLSGTDRIFGVVFGVVRGAVIVGLLVMTGQYTGFQYDDWWGESELIPYGEKVADVIRELAPKGLELITPDETDADMELPDPEEI